MSKIFTRTFRVRWGELDPNGNVTPANHLRYLIETAWDWGIAIGWDADYSRDPDMFWVIRETEMRFLRLLRHNDEFDFTIWLASWQRVRGTRCFEMKFKEGGEVIAQGTQQIVFMDAKTGRPKNMPEEMIETFRVENPRVFPTERFPKIEPAANSLVAQRRVERNDLDAYDHVNNAAYIDFAEEALAQYFSSKGWPHAKLKEANLSIAVRRAHIQYSAMAEWGEMLTISTHPFQVGERGGSHFVGIARVDGSAVTDCILDWELVDRVSGAARPLPTELR